MKIDVAELRQFIVKGESIADQEIAFFRELVDTGDAAGILGLLSLLSGCSRSKGDGGKFFNQLSPAMFEVIARLACLGGFQVVRSYLQELEEKAGQNND